MNSLKKRYKNQTLKWLLIISFPFQFLVTRSEEFKNSSFIEFYNDNYLSISNLRNRFFSFFTISIGDILYFLFTILLLNYIYKNRSYYFNFKTHFFLDILALVSFINIFFQISWGLNYLSKPLETKLNINKSYSVEDLEKTISYLINKTNYLHQKLSKSDTSAINFPFNKKEAVLMLEEEKIGIAKNSLWSNALCYLGYSGYINPFTNEAQVNKRIPMINYLTTIAHEQSHQTGIAREDESNFLAFIKTTSNSNEYIQYAGYCFALRYCLSDLFKKKPNNAKIFLKDISQGVIKNFNESDQFWSKYQNPIEPFFKKIYDRFLKINNQKSGIKSYSEVVSLLIFDIKKHID